MSKPGMPSSWARHPCNEGEWSNDSDEYKEEELLLAPCPPKVSGLRPTSPDESPSGANDQGDEDGQSQFVIDGRPDGFRPGAGIASSTSSGVDGSRASVSASYTGVGGAAGMATIIASAMVAVLAAAFLIARKRRLRLEQQKGGNGSDKAKLIYMDGVSSSGGVSAGCKSLSAGAAIAAANTAAGDTANSIDEVDLEADVDKILADIESFGGERLDGAAADAPQFSPSAWGGDDGAIELDAEAAAAYLAGASTTRSTVGAGTAATAAATTTASVSAASKSRSERRTRSIVSAASRSTSAAVIAASTDESNTVASGVGNSSFVSANPEDIGRRHSGHNVFTCKSSTCEQCQDKFVNVGRVDFVSASKINTDMRSSPRKVLAKLAGKSES